MWEYRTDVLTINYVASGEPVSHLSEFAQQLDGLGAEGWELVSVLPYQDSRAFLRDVLVILKRYIAEDDE